MCCKTACHILNEEKPEDFIWWNAQEIVKNVRHFILLKLMRAKTLLSLTYSAGSPGYWLYSHDSKSLFNYSDDLYQLRRFLLLRSFELQNFKTDCWLLILIYFRQVVWFQGRPFFLCFFVFVFYNMQQGDCYNAALILRGRMKPCQAAGAVDDNINGQTHRAGSIESQQGQDVFGRSKRNKRPRQRPTN